MFNLTQSLHSLQNRKKEQVAKIWSLYFNFASNWKYWVPSGLTMVSRDGNFYQKIWIWIFQSGLDLQASFGTYIVYEITTLGNLNWSAISRAISAMLFLFSDQSEFTFFPFVKHAKKMVMHFILLIFQKRIHKRTIKKAK